MEKCYTIASATLQKLDLQPPKLHVIYEDNDIILEAALHGGGDIVFSFNSHTSPDQKPKRFAYPMLIQHGYSAVFVTAKTNHWWQIPTMEMLVRSLRSDFALYERRICLGSSMGGFGALLFGADLGADNIVVFSPQTYVSAPPHPTQKTWLAQSQVWSVIRDDVRDTIASVPVVSVVYDPFFAVDARYAAELKGFSNVNFLTLPFAGHHCLRVLVESRIFSDVTAKLLEGPLLKSEFRAFLKHRYRSKAYRERLIKVLVQKRHVQTAARLERAWGRIDGHLARAATPLD